MSSVDWHENVAISPLAGYRQLMKEITGELCWLAITSIKKILLSFPFVFFFSSFYTLTSMSISGCTMTGQTAVGLKSPDLEVRASSADVKQICTP